MYIYIVHVHVCIHSVHVTFTNTSEMLSIVGERESAHVKLQAHTALQYVQCGLLREGEGEGEGEGERERERERERESPVHITRRARYTRQ